MTISEKIFELLKARGMTQTEFSRQTGIAESSISDWKRKKTNPSSDSIMIICKVLGVSPEELLSGTRNENKKSFRADYYVVSPDSNVGILIETWQGLDDYDKGRIEGYMKLLLEEKKKKK